MQTHNHHVGYSRKNECWFVRFYPYQTEQKAKDAINAFTRPVAPVDGLETAWGTPRELLAAFGADDIREGSRAVLGDGIEEDKWEDYLEVPVHIFEKMLAKLVTRSQAVAIIAAERAAKEEAENGCLAGALIIKELQTDNAALTARVKELGSIIEGDRTKVIDLVNAISDAFIRRSWLLTSRGSYEWDGDGFRQEFGDAMEEIGAHVDAMRAVGRDLSNCPINADEMAEARIDWRRKAKALETQLAAAEKISFEHGYVLACCNVVNLHDEPTIAHDTLSELGVTRPSVKAMNLSEYDLKALRKIERGGRGSPYGKTPRKARAALEAKP